MIYLRAWFTRLGESCLSSLCIQNPLAYSIFMASLELAMDIPLVCPFLPPLPDSKGREEGPGIVSQSPQG